MHDAFTAGRTEACLCTDQQRATCNLQPPQTFLKGQSPPVLPKRPLPAEESCRASVPA